MAQPPTQDHPLQPASPGARRRYSLFGDLYSGAVRGDFAPELGLAGITAQVVCGFIPGIGTLCAFRDFVACQRSHDRLGMLLNGLSLVPFLGGIPKLAEVARSVRLYAEGIHAVHAIHHFHRMAHSRRHPQDAALAPAPKTPVEHRHNPAAVLSLLIALSVPVAAPLLALAFEIWLAPMMRLDITWQVLIVALLGFAVPLAAIIAGHAGRRRARGQTGYGTGRGIATTGLVLGYLYFLAFLAIAGIFLFIYRPDLTHVFSQLFAALAPSLEARIARIFAPA